MTKNKNAAEEAAQVEETVAASENPETQAAAAEETPVDDVSQQLGKALQDLAAKEKEYLYLRAEYDNFRRRSSKEKTDAYASAKADAVVAFLPVYDNLQRALASPCQDEAFRKGVEMTMTQLKSVLEKLGLHEIDCLGKTIDPNTQNAVMHVEDETVGESVVVEVFQTGFMLGDKIVREAMVKVAN
jgi:molecular chaperone GrpE